MRVFFVCRYFYPYLGGNENQCLKLAKYLKEHKEVFVEIVTDCYSKKLLNFEDIDSIPVTRINSISNLFNIGPHTISIKKQNLFDRIINRFRYTFTEYYFQFSILLHLFRIRKSIDVVHFHQGSFTLFARIIASILKKPVIVKDSTYNGLKILNYLTVLPINNFFFKKINFIAVSSQIKKNFINIYNIPASKIFFIPNGVETIENKINFFKEKNPPKLLFLGNFWQGKIKGLDLLLLALGLVKIKFPNIKLIIAGSGNLEDYSNIIKEYDLEENIEYLGNISFPVELFKQNPIFILPSRSEGMSNSLLEAMSYGLPCISSKVSGSTDIIDHDKNGLLFDIGSVNELEKCILSLYVNADKREKLGNEAIKKINSSFNIEVVAQKYIELYSSLI